MSLKIRDYCCVSGHVFDAWLREEDPAKEPAECPVCGSREVTRRPSAPAVAPVAGTSRAEVAADVRRREARRAAAVRAEAIGRLREVVRIAEDVGRDFPEVVRAMEAGRREKRLVRGECSPLAAAELRSEGIAVACLPKTLLEETAQELN